MATFKVGQRVRIRADANVNPHYADVRGKEATIIGVGSAYDWTLDIPSRKYPGTFVGADSSALEPLTDPKAEAFLESLKRLGREPRIDMPQVIQEHS